MHGISIHTRQGDTRDAKDRGPTAKDAKRIDRGVVALGLHRGLTKTPIGAAARAGRGKEATYILQPPASRSDHTDLECCVQVCGVIRDVHAELSPCVAHRVHERRSRHCFVRTA
jgi:hypothetical protein